MPAKTPEQQATYDANRRRSENLIVRLTPDELLRLKTAASNADETLAAFLLAATEKRPKPMVDLSQVAEMTKAVAVLSGLPQAVRDLDADLGRLSGRLSHLFTITPERAGLYHDEIHETLYALQDLMREVVPEIQKLTASVAEPRTEIANVMKLVGAKMQASKSVGSIAS